jgi:hypothetical protein
VCGALGVAARKTFTRLGGVPVLIFGRVGPETTISGYPTAAKGGVDVFDMFELVQGSGYLLGAPWSVRCPGGGRA